MVLYGFDGSTYVRTVRMLLAEKGAHYEQVPVNVLDGEPRQPEHVARHPFGKVPVLDHDGFRIIETGAIAPYLDEVLPGPSYTPERSRDRARMRMAMSIVDSYGNGALIAVAGYHLFPDFIGGADEEARKHGIANSRRVLQELMKLRGGSAFIAGERPSLGDFYLARSASSFHLPRMPTKSSRWMASPVGGSRYRQCRATRRQHPGLAEIG
jgi:glutathione S-transferase